MPKKYKIKDGEIVETNDVVLTIEQVNEKIALREADILVSQANIDGYQDEIDELNDLKSQV